MIPHALGETRYKLHWLARMKNVERGKSATFTVHLLSKAAADQTIQPVTLSAVNVHAGVTLSFAPETATPGRMVAAESIVLVAIAPNAKFSMAHPASNKRWAASSQASSLTWSCSSAPPLPISMIFARY